MGRRVHVTIGMALDPRKCKFKVTLDAVAEGCPITPMVEEALIGVLTSLRALALHGVATHCGHRYSSGISEISFWVSAAPVGTLRVPQLDAGSASGGPSRGDAASGRAPGPCAGGSAFASSAGVGIAAPTMSPKGGSVAQEVSQRVYSPGASNLANLLALVTSRPVTSDRQGQGQGTAASPISVGGEAAQEVSQRVVSPAQVTSRTVTSDRQGQGQCTVGSPISVVGEAAQ